MKFIVNGNSISDTANACVVNVLVPVEACVIFAGITACPANACAVNASGVIDVCGAQACAADA